MSDRVICHPDETCSYPSACRGPHVRRQQFPCGRARIISRCRPTSQKREQASEQGGDHLWGPWLQSMYHVLLWTRHRSSHSFIYARDMRHDIAWGRRLTDDCFGRSLHYWATDVLTFPLNGTDLPYIVRMGPWTEPFHGSPSNIPYRLTLDSATAKPEESLFSTKLPIGRSASCSSPSDDPASLHRITKVCDDITVFQSRWIRGSNPIVGIDPSRLGCHESSSELDTRLNNQHWPASSYIFHNVSRTGNDNRGKAQRHTV